MTLQKGMGFYHVGAANTNRLVRVQIVADSGAGNNVFEFLLGSNQLPPFSDEISSPATNDYIAAARADAVVRAACIYAIPVEVKLATTTNTNDTIIIGFETAFSGVISSVADITDTLGLAGHTAKTKSGIQTLVTGIITTASLDGGTTLLFSANPNLADGTASTASAVTSLTASLLST